MFLATRRRWCTVPHRFAARHSLGTHRAALQMYHYVQIAKSIVSVPAVTCSPCIINICWTSVACDCIVFDEKTRCPEVDGGTCTRSYPAAFKSWPFFQSSSSKSLFFLSASFNDFFKLHSVLLQSNFISNFSRSNSLDF